MESLQRALIISGERMMSIRIMYNSSSLNYNVQGLEYLCDDNCDYLLFQLALDAVHVDALADL